MKTIKIPGIILQNLFLWGTVAVISFSFNGNISFIYNLLYDLAQFQKT